jgi:TetR/AcrR family transcriptional regulator of autoinduction and epiphytic fitness
MNAEKKLTELKREDIIEAAVSEFKTHGFRATSMDRIAARAQVSKRTVYNHFASKEILFQTITQELCDRVMQVSKYAYDPAIAVKTQLHIIAGQEITLLTSAEFLDMVKMITSESLAAPELTRTNFENFQDTGIGMVEWLRQASDDGKLRVTNPVTASKQFLALIETFALWPQLYGVKPVPDKKQQQTIIDSAVEMFLCTYGVTDGVTD